ncbi:hypothetical protein BOVATA_007890 [Babesia ovata]|uniref:Uncharacterized protein n=1 Tax=Babesia ovata TaxID=189622 RepID=A0A2H6K8H6_9APIC|nr:uncharacterized protein BOVATA_007890 [Babesia ovata]GBE59296.1 hypothetical protein BOVATA_007890 [Babesia ovata]
MRESVYDGITVGCGQDAAVETGDAVAGHTQRLLHGLFESAADRHDLTNRFHTTAEQVVRKLELTQIPLGDFNNHVIQTWLEASCGDQGDSIAHLHQVVTQSYAGSNVCQRVSGSLGRKGGTATEACVQLNNEVLVSFRVDGNLDVALTNDAKVTNNPERDLAVLVELYVGQGLRRSHHDGVACVDTEGVKVLHACRSYAVVAVVTDDLKLDLFPTVQGLVDVNAYGGIFRLGAVIRRGALGFVSFTARAWGENV